MSTRIALIISVVSMMLTLYAGTHPRRPKIYIAATAERTEDARLKTDQHSSEVFVTPKREYEVRNHSR